MVDILYLRVHPRCQGLLQRHLPVRRDYAVQLNRPQVSASMPQWLLEYRVLLSWPDTLCGIEH
jgi:hypothetical protein